MWIYIHNHFCNLKKDTLRYEYCNIKDRFSLNVYKWKLLCGWYQIFISVREIKIMWMIWNTKNEPNALKEELWGFCGIKEKYACLDCNQFLKIMAAS